MLCSKQELFETIEKINGLPMLVVGDIILDRYIWGSVARVSPEAPVPVVDVKQVEDRLGGAANVVRNLCNLGVQVSLCGVIGDDLEGQTVLKLLEKDKVERDGVIIDRGRPTSLKTRVVAQKQQMLRIDRENSSALSPALREGFAAVVDAHIDRAKSIIISDYGKGAISDALFRKLSEAQQAKRIGLQARPLVLDPHPANYSIYQSVTVAKPNRREAELASGVTITDRDSTLEAGRILLKKWKSDMLVITLGEDGLAIISANSDRPIFLETVAQEVFDVSGAGDTVTAIFAAALAAGASPAVAGDLANIGAGVVVSEVGTVAVTIPKLKNEIERLSAVAKKKA
ncbi:MAG: D-glycero-beta-D-manno-heptose-7-phosphate kinase [Deltaproteobacteria bacterium]|nr:D-glycero-beta-D-manno-heptose-7-phosphate kinase [Deltaproteobacteria bacterium]